MILQSLTILAVAEPAPGVTIEFPVYVESGEGGFRSRATFDAWGAARATVGEAILDEAAIVYEMMGRRAAVGTLAGAH